MNTVIGLLAEWGISIAGTRALWVRGRRSGVTRRVVVNAAAPLIPVFALGASPGRRAR